MLLGNDGGTGFAGQWTRVHVVGYHESLGLYSAFSRSAVMRYRFEEKKKRKEPKTGYTSVVPRMLHSKCAYLFPLSFCYLCLCVSTSFMFVCSPHSPEKIADYSNSCCCYWSSSHVKAERFHRADLKDWLIFANPAFFPIQWCSIAVCFWTNHPPLWGSFWMLFSIEHWRP